MNPYRLKNVYDYLTSNNQLLKKKLKLGTDDIPIPPKRDDVTTIEAINRFNKANPRVDTTNLKPLSVKHSNVRQSNVNEPNEGMIQGAYDTATREAQSEGFPAPSYDKFKSRYLKKNMKADGGRIGYKDGLGPNDQPMGPVYTTNKIEDAAKEVVKRLIKLDGVDIPLTDKISMSLGPGLNRTEIRGVIDILGGELNIGGGMKGDDKGIGFTFRKEFQDGGMLVQPSDDGSRPGYAKDKAPIGSEIRKINKKTSPYYGKWAYRVVENGERVTKYSDIKPKSPDTSPKHPYVNSKDFKNFLEEYKITNPDWTPKKGYAAILDKYERGLARKNKIVGVPELVEVLGEKSPYTEQTLINIFAKTQKKITKNMSKKEKADIKNAKRLYKVFEDTIGAPSKFSDTLNEYNYIRQFPSEKRYQSAWDYNPSKIKKLNKALNKYYNQVGDLQTSTIDNIFKFLDNKNLIAEIKNYKGGSISQDSPIFTNLLKEYKGGKDPSYAFMQLGRALRGEIQIDGIEKNLKLGNRIIKLTADNYRGPLGNSFLEWAKLQMAKDFDDPSNTYKSLTTKIRNSMKSIGITDLSGLAIDEIFPARTGQLTLKGSGAYNQIIQFIDGEINSKAKAAFDGRSSTRYQQIVDNIKNKNFDKVQEIVNNHNLDINSFYEKYPQAKGKVKLTKLNYDSANKRFLSPTEIYGADVLPSKILKGMEKFYAKTGLSLDVGSTTTLEKAAAELSGDTKTQAKLLRKMGFKCKFAGKKGGLGSCDDPASYTDDINKTRADLKSNDVTVRAVANAKLNKGLQIAKTLPTIGKFLRRVGQATVGGVSKALQVTGLGSTVGLAIEGIVEGGIYDYYRKQGYTHDQAYQEGFIVPILTGRPEGVPWYGSAESLLEKELIGDPQQNKKVAQYVSTLKDQDQVYDAFGRLQQGQQASRKDIIDAAQADIRDLNKSGTISNIDRIMNPESMASRAYNTAVERQLGLQDQRARDYKAKNYAQTEPSEFMQEQKLKDRNKAMLEMFPMYTPEVIDSMYQQANIEKPENFSIDAFNNVMRDQDKMNYFADNFRLEKASGGIASLTDTIPPESGPTPHGLPYVYNNVKKI